MAIRTPKEIKDFSEMYVDPEVNITELCELFGLASGSIYRRGFELGLTRPKGAKATVNLAQIREYVQALMVDMPAIATKPMSAHKLTTKPGDVILILGDLHAGRLTSTTNTEVLGRRVEALALRVAEAVQRQGLTGCKLSVFIVGDLVTGERVGGQVSLEELEHTVLEQCFNIALPYLTRMLTYFTTVFSTVDVYSVAGNHGPVSKPALSTGANWDNVVMLGLQAMMTKFKQVTFDIATVDFYNFATVGGIDWLLVHGDQMRGGNAVGSLGKVMNDWHRSMTQHFDLMALGHFHEINKVRDAYMTGCFVTDDEWSREVVKREGDCAQLLLTVGKGKVRAICPIYLDDIKAGQGTDDD
jgi:hypothetical protein